MRWRNWSHLLVTSVGHNEYHEKLNKLKLLWQIWSSGGDVDIEEIQLGIHHTGDPGTADVDRMTPQLQSIDAEMTLTALVFSRLLLT